MKNIKKNIWEFLYRVSSLPSQYFLKKIINDNIKDCKTILDLWCWKWSLNWCNIKDKDVIWMDVFWDYLSELKKMNTWYKDYINSNIMDVDKFFWEKSIDCIVMIEVIEHLEEKNAILLLEKIQKIAKKRVIIHTPNWYLVQSPFDWNEYQRHLSWYDVDFFKENWFNDIYWMWWYKKLRWEFWIPAYSPKLLFHILSELTEIFVFKMPRLAFQLLAIKNIK